MLEQNSFVVYAHHVTFASEILGTPITAASLNRPGFDVASFFMKDEVHGEALPGRAT